MTLEVNGISIERINSLIHDITIYADNINLLVNKIDDELTNYDGIMQSEVCYRIKESYDTFRTNSKIINSNILSYGIDYTKVKSDYILRDSSMANKMDMYSQEIRKKVI